MRKVFYFVFPAGIFVAVVFCLSQKLGPLPSLGPFLSFNDGVFSQYKKNISFGKKSLSFELKNLEHPVEVFLDSNLIPHIFAGSKKDLYRAQGYVTAQFRLWQMDMTTRAAGGQLSEVLGAKAQKIDELFIKMGLREASKRALDEMMEDPATQLALTAYVDGVNQYISSLSYKDWPVEYKVVQSRPQLFEPIRVAQLLKIMSFNLSGRSYDLALTEIVQKLGWNRSVELFPDFFGHLDNGQNLDDIFMQDQPLTKNISKSIKTSNAGLAAYPGYSSAFANFPDFLLPFQNDGSNSWALSAEKSSTGHVIMSNDTHLGLKIPAVWMENHLVVENSDSENLDVYGASFPGTPGVILGFNQNFSWGATNGTIDVLDWYEIEFRDEKSTDYMLDGRFVRAEVWNEELKIYGQKNAKLIPMVWTEFGPLLHREGKLGLTLRWTSHEPSNELSAFLQLDEAKSVTQAREILKNFKNPIQNFTLADAQRIAIFTPGLIPKRAVGQGRVVENGRSSKNNWSGYLSASQSPFLENPSQGFVHSANQRPEGSDFPSYLGWDFEEPFRGLRIREVLSAHQKISPQDVMKMQNESLNELAVLFFQVVDRNLVVHELSNDYKARFDGIVNWKFLDLADSVSSTQFYTWFKQIENKIWGKEFSFQKRPYFPKKAFTLKTMEEMRKKSSIDFYKMLASAYVAAMDQLEKDVPQPEGHKWGNYQPTRIPHITQFPGLGAGDFHPDGSRYSLNSNKGNHGGAWRLVVEMSNPPKAWSQIPGSTDGDPLSPNYTKGIEQWTRGEFRTVGLKTRSELIEEKSQTWRFNRRSNP